MIGIEKLSITSYCCLQGPAWNFSSGRFPRLARHQISIKVTLQPDLFSTAHAETLRVKSTAHNLQCLLKRYLKNFNINNDACFYNNEMVAESINRMWNQRWRCHTSASLNIFL